MKIYLSILLLIFSCLSITGQTAYQYNYKEGSRFIIKAEKHLNRGNLAKAEDFISKAKKSDFGFCGNAWMSAYSQITIIEVRLLNTMKEYDKALTLLDSLNGCVFDADCSARDSLKIITLILKYGKEKVQQSFKSVSVVHIPDYPFFGQSFWVELEDFNYVFLFYVPYSVYISERDSEAEEMDIKFYDIAKNLSFYKLLQ